MRWEMELVCTISQMMEQIQNTFAPTGNDAEELTALSDSVQQHQKEYMALLYAGQDGKGTVQRSHPYAEQTDLPRDIGIAQRG